MQQAKNESTRLSKLNGAAFDKAYAASEVAYHQKVNARLQNTLIPSATYLELQELLSKGLKTFRESSEHAEQLSDKLR